MSRRPRRILITVRHAVGGIRTYLKYVFGGLDSERYQLMIVAVRGEETSALEQDLRRFQPIVRLVSGDRAFTRLAFATLSAARSWKPHVIHAQGFTAGVAATPAALVTRTPHLITSHNVFRDDEFDGLRGATRRRVLTFVLNQASLIHVVGEGAEENTLRFLPGLRPALLRIVRNGVPSPAMPDPAQASAWRESVSGGAEVLFGFFGRFMPEKGFDVLIRAAEILHKSGTARRFRILAINDGSFVREYRAKIATLGMADNFEFLGFSPDATKLMAQVDAVVMPSLREACPLVAMEAMAAGAPFISTTIPAVNELAKGSPSILVAPGDPDALANAMSLVINDPQRRKSEALAYSSTATRLFDIRETVAGLERLYSHLSPSI